MSFVLNPPPDSKDDRFNNWLALLWKYVTGNTSDSAEMIEASQVFGKKTTPGFPTTIYYAESQSILATQIFGQ